MVNRILGHWDQDKSGAYNPDRQDALSVAQIANSVEEAEKKIEEIEGQKPILAVTGANFEEYEGTSADLVQKISVDNRPCLLLFGTGWGLNATILDRADFRLDPIVCKNTDGYNHLSVRSAVAIYLDRLTR